MLIGRRTRVGKGVRIYSHVALGALGLPGTNPFMDVRDYVQIYHGAMVGGNCVIGEYAEIGLNAVVLHHDIPPYASVVGNGLVVKIDGERVDPKDYKNYVYNPADFHGPPKAHLHHRIGSHAVTRAPRLNRERTSECHRAQRGDL